MMFRVSLVLCVAALLGINANTAKDNKLKEGDACRGGGVETGPKFDYSARCPDGTDCLRQRDVDGIGGEVPETCQYLPLIADGVMYADGVMTPETERPTPILPVADGTMYADGAWQGNVVPEVADGTMYADGASQGNVVPEVADGTMYADGVDVWNTPDKKGGDGGDGAGAEFNLEETVMEILKSVGLAESQVNDVVAELKRTNALKPLLKGILAGETPDMSKVFDDGAVAAAISDSVSTDMVEEIAKAAAAYSGPDPVILDGVMQGDDDDEDSSYFATAGLVSLAAAALAASSF